jgi:hypothetical protein
MTLLLIGVIGALLMGLISKLFYTAAAAKRRLSAEKPFGGAVPAWVSIAYLGFFGCAIYGVIKIIF